MMAIKGRVIFWRKENGGIREKNFLNRALLRLNPAVPLIVIMADV